LVAAAIVVVALSVCVAVPGRIQRLSEAKESRLARLKETTRRANVLKERLNLTRKKDGPRIREMESEFAEITRELRTLAEEDREARKPLLGKFLDLYRPTEPR